MPRKKKNGTAKRFTQEKKDAAVLRVAGGSSFEVVAKSIGCSTNSVRLWVQASNDAARPKSTRQTNGGLPTTDAPKATRRATPRAVIATVVECPNCGCALDMKAAPRLAVPQ